MRGIATIPSGIQQVSSAFIAGWPLPAALPHPQLLSAVRERRGAEFSTLQHFQAASRGGGGFLPGARVLLDAHNCYPEQGRWSDRLERALKTGLPMAIEQDLAWHTDKASGRSWSVVVHHLPPSGSEPTVKTYFFEQIRPLVEHALQSGDRKDWPLITLNLDFKTEEREHLEFIWRLLGEYEDWLCTAPRTATPETPATLELRPVLVLTGSSDAQQKVFHDAVPVGGRLRLFGAVNLPNNKPTPLDLGSLGKQLSPLVEQFLGGGGRGRPAELRRLDAGRGRTPTVACVHGSLEGSVDSLLHAERTYGNRLARLDEELQFRIA